MNETLEYNEMGNHYLVEVLNRWKKIERIGINENNNDIFGLVEHFELKIIGIYSRSTITHCGEIDDIFEVSRLADCNCGNGWRLS